METKIERIPQTQKVDAASSGTARTIPKILDDVSVNSAPASELSDSLQASKERLSIPKKLFDGVINQLSSNNFSDIKRLKMQLDRITSFNWRQYQSSKFYGLTEGEGFSLKRWFGRLMGWHKFAERVDALKTVIDHTTIPEASTEQQEAAATKIQTLVRGRKVRNEVVLPKQIRQAAGTALERAGLSDDEQIAISRVMAREIRYGDDVGTRLEAGNKLYPNPDALPVKKVGKAKAKLDPKLDQNTLEAPTDIIAQKNRLTVIGKKLGAGTFKQVSASVELQDGRRVKEGVLVESKPEEINTVLQGMKFISEHFTPEEIEKYRLAGILTDTARKWKGTLQASDVRYKGDAHVLAKQMTEKQKYALLKTAAYALQAFHAKGLIHRDVKPANILLDDDHNAYLNDFDLSCEAGQRRGVAGTPGFIDELSQKLKIATPYADVYALAQTASLLGCKKYKDILKAIEAENLDLVAFVHANPAIKAQLISTDPNIRRQGMAAMDKRFPNFAKFLAEVQKS